MIHTTKFVVIGDIGGTKTLLALYALENENIECRSQSRYQSQDFPSFEIILKEYLSKLAAPQLDAICIGVAGPVVHGQCRATNLPWIIAEDSISELSACPRVKLINDFEANAFALGLLGEHQTIALHERNTTAGGTMALIGAGTGLGQAIVVPKSDSSLPHVIVSEGGHCDFSPRNDREWALRSFLAEDHEHVSWERVLSGPGLEQMYRFVAQIDKIPSQISPEKIIDSADPAAEIGNHALAQSDQRCQQTVAWFLDLYGAETGNLALKCLPTAGVFVAGGIAAKLHTLFRSSSFLTAFQAKGRMQTLLDLFRIDLVIDPELGLQGSLAVAQHLLRSQNER